MSEVRKSYDTVAREYVRRIAMELAGKPLDRQWLARFHESIPSGTIADLGCGPGHVTRFLADRGADVIGIDLSPGMIAEARLLNPDLKFRVGDMTALDAPDGAFAGVLAFYSIVNFAPSALPRVFSEIGRVLATGGRLLLSFHRGEGSLHLDDWWDARVDIDFHFFATDAVVRLVAEAGLVVDEALEREPYAEVEHPSRRAYLFCRKPEAT